MGQGLGLTTDRCERTRSSVISNLVVFVVVHAFDDINLSRLRTIL